MIKNFFRILNQSNVKYMLISGQATVLYGAATFSEDIDVWVSPEPEKHFSAASKEIAFEIEELRRKDRIYWHAIINELKELNSYGKLFKIGSTPR